MLAIAKFAISCKDERFFFSPECKYLSWKMGRRETKNNRCFHATICIQWPLWIRPIWIQAKHHPVLPKVRDPRCPRAGGGGSGLWRFVRLLWRENPNGDGECFVKGSGKCQPQSPGSLREGVLPHCCWDSSFPLAQGLMHRSLSVSGLRLQFCLSATPSTLGGGHESSWAEKSSLCCGEGAHLENQAAVALVSSV